MTGVMVRYDEGYGAEWYKETVGTIFNRPLSVIRYSLTTNYAPRNLPAVSKRSHAAINAAVRKVVLCLLAVSFRLL